MPKRSASSLNLARRIQRLLQRIVERVRAEEPAVHRGQHLDVAPRIEAEPFGHAIAHQLHHGFGDALRACRAR